MPAKAKQKSGLIETISTRSALVSAFALWAILVVVIASLVMRYVFNNPLGIAVEGAAYLYMPFIMMSLAYTQRLKAHTQITGVVEKLPYPLRGIVNVIMLLLFLFFCALMLWGGLRGTSEFMEQGVLSQDVQIPLWLVAMFIPLGAILLFLQVALELTREVRQLLTGKGGA